MPAFTPLNLALIEEGEFVQQADADLLDLQRQLVAYAAAHGRAAAKARAKLTIEITLGIEDATEGLYSVAAKIRAAMPARPAAVSLAMAAAPADGAADCLFVRRTGSSEAPPTQAKLWTRDGRPADAAEAPATPAPARTD